MKKIIEVKVEPSVDELAEMLFNLDEREVVKLFKVWNNKFETNWLEARQKGEKGMFIHSLYHFFLYVADNLDDEGKDFFKDAYSAILYKQ